MPDEEDMPRFEPSVSLDIEEFTIGLIYKKGISSNQAQPVDVKDSTTVQNQDPPVIVEDCDSSDDESNEDEARQSNTMTKEVSMPLENHILCDPLAKLCVTAPVKIVEAHIDTCENANLLYTLIGSDKVYSNKDFPIKNVNQSFIDKVFEDSTSKFLGKSSPGVVVTQCALIPKAEVRKQYGNQKLPYQQKQNHANQGKRKGKRAQNKKKFQKINFMKSRGTDKFETFKNKSNMNFVKQVQILKRNS
ncbi:hypothetical protein HanRHA438_Chr04g0155751 [Helianthus annuus]|nr:hypothetical protein HanRHA438_Chr04g0155751 [Helianthus annuus]